MSDKIDGRYTFTKPVVMAFPTLAEARKFKRNGKETGEAKFSASFVLPPEHSDLAAMKAHVIGLVKAKWPGLNIGEAVKSGELKLPWGSGDKLADRRVAKFKLQGKEDDKKGDFMRGNVMLKTASKYPPLLSILANGKIITLEDEAQIKSNVGKFYFGCEVVPQINFVAYDPVGEDGKPGVTAYLDQVLTLNKGKKLAGSSKNAAETFKGYAGQATGVDPTADDDLGDEF